MPSLAGWEHQPFSAEALRLIAPVQKSHVTWMHIGYTPSIPRWSSSCDASWRSQTHCLQAKRCKHRHFQLGNPRQKYNKSACEHSCSALHQEQNPLGMGTVFTELSYLFVLGAQFLLSQNNLSESPNLCCSPPADYIYICIYDIQI